MLDLTVTTSRIAKSRPPARRAFTLIELLVVVGIIILLIAILLPALGIAKQQTRKTETNSLLTGLMTNIQAYYQTFAAYPGPVPLTGGSGATTGGANKISGTQNLLIGLSYPMQATSGSGYVQIGGAGGIYVNNVTASGPADLSVTPTRNHSPFYSPAVKELLKNNGNVGWTAGNFPTIVDRYPDALPILYYRRKPGVDTLLTSTSSTNEAYSLTENSEYTAAASLTSSSGTTYPQSASNVTTTYFNSLITAPGGGSARGSFVLISAGQDRTYGTVNNKTDDIVVVGP